jgi:hypothetical protein
MAALMLTCTLLLSNRQRMLPLLFLVWANLHSAVLLGLVVMGAACIAALVRDRRVPVDLVVVTAACVAAVCLTPMGLQFWPEVLSSLERSKTNGLIEWSPPGWQPVLWPFWAMAAALPVAAILFRRRLRGTTITMVAVALALLPLAARSMRNVSMFMLVAVPAITMLARRDDARAPVRRAKERSGLNAAVLGVAAVGSVILVGFAWAAPLPLLGWQPIAPAAIQAIAGCDDPIYNTFEAGGAIIWFVPQKKVFIDNRQDPYSPELLSAAHQVESDGRYERLFVDYGIRCAVVPGGSATAKALSLDPSWFASYDDQRLNVFISRR